MKFKSLIKFNSFSFARNFKSPPLGMRNSDEIKMAEMLSEKVLGNLANNKGKINKFLEKFPTEESYLKYIYANKFGLDVDKVDKVDYSKLTDHDLMKFGDSLFKEAFENVLNNDFKGNPQFKNMENVLDKKSQESVKQQNKNFETKGEKIIDVSTVSNEGIDEKNLKDLMEELEKNNLFKTKLEQNLKEKDINKIQANIFKKEKKNKDDKKAETENKSANRNNRNNKF